MKHILSILILLTVCMGLSAQEQTTLQQRFDEAYKLYDSGKFDQCQKASVELLKDAKNEFKTNTYRLLALCYLAQDNIACARTYVDLMLKYDPYFTPSINDPQRFKDLVSENKSQEAGITTASRQTESLDEAPVPVTLITEDMIQHSGATTLQEVLCLFVPGMTIAEGLETSAAMHGIYSLMQDKILIMVDGFRLNSSTTNGESLDYRTSLDKVQQIEVLRGPASSLYGNVALTAVVNIKTKKGAQFNNGKGGGKFTGIAGTGNTFGGSFIVGGGNNVLDIMGWGSVLYSKGDVYTINNGLEEEYNQDHTAYSYGFRNSPSYDLGVKGRWKDFTLSINLQRSKKTPYINMWQFPADKTFTQVISGRNTFSTVKNFSYDRYPNIDGNGPGLTRSNNRINLEYSHSFNKFDISASGFINFENTYLYNVMGDTINSLIAYELLNFLQQTDPEAGDRGEEFRSLINSVRNAESLHTEGVYQIFGWSGVTYGLQTQFLTNYNVLGHGSLIFGAQYENFSPSSSRFTLGGSFSSSSSVSSNAICKEGSENSISGYLQLKHLIPSEKLIFNAGVRFDHKQRFNGNNLDNFSPRFSIIWKMTDKMSIRSSYNYSFVDAPYIYRASILKIFGGGSDMRPETMQSFNLGLTYYNRKHHLSAEISGFYNILNDLCVLNVENMLNFQSEAYELYEYLIKNAGMVRVVGIDGEAQYNKDRFFANFNATWQKVVDSENYIVYNGQTYSTPEFHFNCTLSGAPYVGRGSGFFDGGRLWVRGSLQFQTATYSPSTDILAAAWSSFTENQNFRQFTRVAPQCNIGLGVSYEWKHLDIDLSLKNILNNTYPIGSMLADGVPHSGRNFVGKVTVKF